MYKATYTPAKLVLSMAVASLLLVAGLVAWPTTAGAEHMQCNDGFSLPDSLPSQEAGRVCQSRGGGPKSANAPVKEEEEEKTVCETDPNNEASVRKCLEENPIFKTINDIIKFLTVGVVVIIIIMVAVGGVQYASATDNAQQVQAAKDHIKNAILALVAYIFLYAFLDYLIPGGIIG